MGEKIRKYEYVEEKEGERTEGRMKKGGLEMYGELED